jgi:hypothetical protein
MKKFLIIGSIVAVVLVSLSVVGLAYAKSALPAVWRQTGFGPSMMSQRYGNGSGYGPGMMRQNSAADQLAAGSGMMWGNGGGMHQYMLEALAEKLGLTVEDLQNRVAAGETPYEIAQAQGLTDEQIRTLFEEAHDAALDKAVAAGVLTQEQADLMDEHMESMWANGAWPGMMGGQGYGGMHGGQGRGGMMGGQAGNGQAGNGLLQPYMQAAVAAELGLTVEAYQARLDAGDTAWTIAQEQGLTTEQFTELMTRARTTALAAAVEAGVITQAQADWMSQRTQQGGRGNGNGRGYGAGAGSCPMQP